MVVAVALALAWQQQLLSLNQHRINMTHFREHVNAEDSFKYFLTDASIS
jgi:hypothetical protein